jgi:hypothetical protein
MVNKGYNIQKNEQNHLYSLHIQGNYNTHIYNFIIDNKIIKHPIYDDETNKLYFNAENVSTLQQLLFDYEKLQLCIHYLILQIQYHEQHNFTFYGFDFDDILVINYNTFFIANANYLTPIIHNHIAINHLLQKPYFNSPEISSIICIPAKIHYKSCYYSLACLIIFLYSNGTTTQIQDVFKQLHHTKIYMFLERCLELRVLLFV